MSHADRIESIDWRENAPLENTALNELFGAAWGHHTPRDFTPILQHSLTWITAHPAIEATPVDHSPIHPVIGFVNVAWDGGLHAFLLDTTVHPDWQRRGVGQELVRRAVATARQHGAHWLHVDYEPHLTPFYARCGFRPTTAGLLSLIESS